MIVILLAMLGLMAAVAAVMVGVYRALRRLRTTGPEPRPGRWFFDAFRCGRGS
jgi:hypothetical protein